MAETEEPGRIGIALDQDLVDLAEEERVLFRGRGQQKALQNNGIRETEIELSVLVVYNK